MEVWDDIYKRELIQINNLSFKENLLHEDELFTPLVFFKAKKVKLIDTDFYYYRQREGSIMNTLKSGKRFKALIYIYFKILCYREIIEQNLIINNYFYNSYSDLIAKNKILSLKEHFLIFMNLKLPLQERLWFFKIFRYVKEIKFQTKI
ncbi:hypothetical protein HS141_15845 [Cetobacterium somerae]|nr:hypothetical protein [Cetobacterium somerae]